MPENLVVFPEGPGRQSTAVGAACATFCSQWRGTDLAEGARLLLATLPPRVPGGLRLAIARALGDLDVPPFSSREEFLAAVQRFAAPAGLVTISDVRRARRHSRLTLRRIAQQTATPLYLLRQLEWGDFRQWRDEDAAERVSRAYARAAGLDPERVVAIVKEERSAQWRDRLTAPVLSAAEVPQPDRLRWLRMTAAAAALLACGILIGAFVNRDLALRNASTVAAGSTPTPAVQTAAPSAPPLSAEPIQPAPDENDTETGAAPLMPSEADEDAGVAPTTGVKEPAPLQSVTTAERDRPQLSKAVTGPAPTFSPAFSSVGTAVFFHKDDGAGSALMKAQSGETGELQVISLVDDGARNYHVKPSPDGTNIAFDSDRDGERGVYIADASGGNVRRVSGPGFAAVPSWSPDGNRLAFVRAEPRGSGRVWNLWLLDLRSNALVRLTSHAYGQPWGASWFPDGRRLAYSHETTLNVLDIESGARKTFRSPRPGQLLRTPAVSPDGRHVAFQVHRDGAWLLDLEDGSMRRILGDPTAEEFAWDAGGRRLAFHSRRSGQWAVWIMSGPPDS